MNNTLQSQLQSYLIKAHPEQRNLRVKNLQRIASGWENEMYTFELDSAAGESGLATSQNWVLQPSVLRIYPGADAVEKSAREFENMAKLAALGYPVPRVTLSEPDPSHLGRPFIIMEWIDGEEMWALLKRGSKQEQEGLLQQFCRLYIRLHRLDWRSFVTDPTEIETGGEFQFVDHWLGIAENSLARFPGTGLEPVLEWLIDRSRSVPAKHPSVVHFDFHPRNILVRVDGSAIVIDWPGLTVTDARFDLGWTLLLSHVYMGESGRDLILSLYERALGKPVEQVKFFIVFACLRRLFDISVSITVGAEKLGMRPETAESIKGDLAAVERVYALLRQNTGIRVVQVEKIIGA